MRQKNFIFGGNNPVPEAKTAKLALLPRNLLSIEREVKGDLSRVVPLGRKKHTRIMFYKKQLIRNICHFGRKLGNISYPTLPN